MSLAPIARFVHWYDFCLCSLEYVIVLVYPIFRYFDDYLLSNFHALHNYLSLFSSNSKIHFLFSFRSYCQVLGSSQVVLLLLFFEKYSSTFVESFLVVNLYTFESLLLNILIFSTNFSCHSLDLYHFFPPSFSFYLVTIPLAS